MNIVFMKTVEIYFWSEATLLFDVQRSPFGTGNTA
jgi:hypothetical protein